METSFWFGTTMDQFIFTGLKISTPLGFAMTCITMMLSAFLFEVLRLTVQKLVVIQRSKRKITMHRIVCPGDCNSSVSAKKGNLKRFGKHVQHVLLYIMQYILGYVLMLAVMTYNGYIMLSVVLGGGLGHLVIGHEFLKLQLKNAVVNKHCPACKDQGGELQQLGGLRALETEEGPVPAVVIGERPEPGNEEKDHFIEPCTC